MFGCVSLRRRDVLRLKTLNPVFKPKWIQLYERKEQREAQRLTEDFTDHEHQADGGHHVQPPLGHFLLPLTILPGVAVVMAMLDGAGGVYLRRHLVGRTGRTLKNVIKIRLNGAARWDCGSLTFVSRHDGDENDHYCFT